MLHTLYHHPCPAIGLAAPQVGQSLRMFVIDVDYERKELETGEVILENLNPRLFINPIFKDKKGETTYQEGCLSVPGIYEEVCRSKEVAVEYRDLENRPCILETTGMLAICLQHENDHLDGIVFLERLSALKRELLTKKYLKERKKQTL